MLLIHSILFLFCCLHALYFKFAVLMIVQSHEVFAFFPRLRRSCFIGIPAMDIEGLSLFGASTEKTRRYKKRKGSEPLILYAAQWNCVHNDNGSLDMLLGRLWRSALSHNDKVIDA